MGSRGNRHGRGHGLVRRRNRFRGARVRNPLHQKGVGKIGLETKQKQIELTIKKW